MGNKIHENFFTQKILNTKKFNNNNEVYLRNCNAKQKQLGAVKKGRCQVK